MKHGDLDNTPVPRVIVVFEGLIASLPEDSRDEYLKHSSKNRWWQAVDLYEINELAIARLLHLCLRDNLNVNLVTWMPSDAAVAIEDRMNDLSIPVRGCFHDSPYLLAQRLAYNPDIVCVYDPDPAHALVYGSKGKLVTDVNQIGR